MIRMTHMILPGMLRRNRGVVLNIGSISGAFSTPLATVYAATKVPLQLTRFFRYFP